MTASLSNTHLQSTFSFFFGRGVDEYTDFACFIFAQITDICFAFPHGVHQVIKHKLPLSCQEDWGEIIEIEIWHESDKFLNYVVSLPTVGCMW